jgi:hypothetical protein
MFQWPNSHQWKVATQQGMARAPRVLLSLRAVLPLVVLVVVVFRQQASTARPPQLVALCMHLLQQLGKEQKQQLGQEEQQAPRPLSVRATAKATVMFMGRRRS